MASRKLVWVAQLLRFKWHKLERFIHCAFLFSINCALLIAENCADLLSGNKISAKLWKKPEISLKSMNANWKIIEKGEIPKDYNTYYSNIYLRSLLQEYKLEVSFADLNFLGYYFSRWKKYITTINRGSEK